MSRSATSTRVRESAVLQVPLEATWKTLRLLDFARLFPSQVVSCTLASGVSNDQGTFARVVCTPAVT